VKVKNLRIEKAINKDEYKGRRAAEHSREVFGETAVLQSDHEDAGGRDQSDTDRREHLRSFEDEDSLRDVFSRNGEPPVFLFTN
jgi:hypothetical protein